MGFNPIAPITTTLPVFTPQNIKIEAYANAGDAGAYNSYNNTQNNLVKMNGAGGTVNLPSVTSLNSTGAVPGAPVRNVMTDPVVIYTNNAFNNGNALFKTYFEYSPATGGTTTFSTPIVIDSVRGNINGTGAINQQTGTWGAVTSPTFLVGGSRVGTLDNGPGTINNTAEVNLAGILVSGFVAETSGTSAAGNRQITNSGIITDEVETTHYQNSAGLGGLLAPVTDQNGILRYSDGSLNTDNGARASTTVTLPGYSETATINVTRTPGTGVWDSLTNSWTSRVGGGYVGYKIGLLLTHENNDTNGNRYTLANNNTIRFSGTNSIGIQVEADGSPNVVVNALNNGQITLNGANSYGMKLSSRVAPTSLIENQTGGTINMNSSNSAGIAVIEEATNGFDRTTAANSVRSHTGIVKNTGTININNGTNQNSVGMYLQVQADDDIINEGTINIDSYRGVGMLVREGTVATDGTNTTGPKAINRNTINLRNTSNEAGASIGMASTGKSQVTNETSGRIVLTGTRGLQVPANTGTWIASSGMYSSGTGSLADNKGTITGTGLSNTVGMAIAPLGTGTNSGTITVSGSRIGGVYNQASFTNTGGSITASGTGAAVYAVGTNNTNINAGTITSSGGAIGLYANGTSVINLGTGTTAPSLVTNSGGLMFYNNPVNSTTAQVNRFNMVNNVSGTVNSGGLAFALRGINSAADLTTALNNMFAGSAGKLTLAVKDGASLYTILNTAIATGSQMKLSELGTASGSGMTALGNHVQIDGANSGNYKILTISGGNILVDENVNLDNTADKYNRIDKASSSITVNAGNTMTGTQANQLAVGQRNTITTNPADMKITNNGTITLSGATSTGLAAETGTVLNTGTVSVNGAKSTGLFGADGAIITNDTTGAINIGTEGAGILAQKDLDGTPRTLGLITVENKGNITANTGGTKVIGIYADNTGGPVTSTVSHTSGTIDLSRATASLGIYTKDLDLTSAGNITATGKGSAGIKGVNSNVTVSGGTIEIGEESIGVILENFTPKTFNGTGGTLSITGPNSVGYYITGSTATSGTNFIDNLTLNPNGNKYTYIFAENSTLNYENTKTIDVDGSVLIHAKNSNVNLGAANNITSANDKVVAVYIKDSGTATNNGAIEFSGEKAVGLYGENGGHVVNNNTIKIEGADSVAVYAKGNVSTATNTANGTITLDGDNLIGMRYEIGTGTSSGKLLNEGNITSTGIRAIGMSNDGGTRETRNDGIITFTGDRSIGIHSSRLGPGHAIINTGVISVGDSADATNPSVGIYTDNVNDTVSNYGEVKAGNQSIGIYGTNVWLGAASKTIVGDNAVGVYSSGGNVNIDNGAELKVGNGESVGVYYSGSNGNIISNTSNITIGDSSFGFVIKGGSGNNFESNGTGTVNLGNDAVFIYSNDTTGTVKNHTNLVSSATGERNYGIYTNGGGDNYGNINFSAGKGNVGIYSYLPEANGGFPATVTPAAYRNHGVIDVSASDLTNANDQKFGIGMGAGYIRERVETELVFDSSGAPVIDAATGLQKTKKVIYRDVMGLGNIENHGTIRVTTPNSIGMYAGGKGSIAKNYGNIELSGTDLNVGMFLEDEAVGYNYGHIYTTGTGNIGQVGIAVLRGATLYNMPGSTVTINSEDGIGIAIAGGIIANYGSFVVTPKQQEIINGAVITATGDNGKAIANVTADASKAMGTSPINRVAINVPTGSYDATITYNGVEVDNVQTVYTIPNRARTEIPTSAIGIYMDTSGVNVTRPVTNLGLLTGIGIKSVDLIIGTEATEYTNEKYIKLGDDLIEPYNEMILEAQRQGMRKWEVYSSSLTWMATAIQNTGTQLIENAYLVKVPYTVWSGKMETPVNSSDTYNFLDGLDQRYGVEALGTRERELFSKLNSIGNNEHVLLVQAFDEMMGHQYGNTQQRMEATGSILDKEFKYLKKQWETKSKESNKMKVFGSRGEYKTDTAGIIDYTNNAYGLAYVHEDETIKLGNTTGWYAGAVYNRFKLKDIGKSTENTTMLKAGIFKTKAFDDNGSLKWTIAGEGYVSKSDMNRRFLVVDDIFSAQSTYYSYGVGLINELSKEFRTSENTSITPYGSLKLGYGRFNGIKEDTGEIRLEIESNGSYSIKPEIGIEFKYQKPVAQKSKLITTFGVAYENELGKVSNGGNRGRVRYTSADWFGIRTEKEDRKGNIKADFNLGIENQRAGFTLNLGYDTKGENIRGGIGFRAIY